MTSSIRKVIKYFRDTFLSDGCKMALHIAIHLLQLTPAAIVLVSLLFSAQTFAKEDYE